MRILRHLTDVLQQAEVLEVARAHLQAVDVGMDHLAVLGVHDFRERFQAVFLSPGLHDLQRFLTKALEAVRIRARFERAATNPVQAETRDAFGDFVELLFALDGARAGEDRDLVGARAVIGKLLGYGFHFAHTDGVSFITLRIAS